MILGERLYVRIDTPLDGKKPNEEEMKAHKDYISKLAEKSYLVGGGFENEKGGMIVFRAENRQQARDRMNQDPLIKRNYYQYKLYTWDLEIVSQ